MKKSVIIPILVLIWISGCKEDTVEENSCGPDLIVSDEFGTVISDPHTITAVSLTDSCLEVEIAAGGCSGESWVANLYASPLFAESYPPQTSLKIVFEDDELCEAAIKRFFHFDLKPLDDFSNDIILHLEGWDQPISYSSVDIENLPGSWNLIHINGGLAGFDIRFDKGEITWVFNASEVTVKNNSSGDDYSGFESGTYQYSIANENGYKSLEINDQNLGTITHLSTDSLVVDQRHVDGFQFVLLKID